MSTVIDLSRAHCGAPADDSLAIERQQAIENALSMALHLVRQPDCTRASLQAATARATRAATMLKHASEHASATGRA